MGAIPHDVRFAPGKSSGHLKFEVLAVRASGPAPVPANCLVLLLSTTSIALKISHTFEH